MYRRKIERILEEAVRVAFSDQVCDLEDFFQVSLELSLNEDYGDYSSVIAIKIANALSMDSFAAAEKIIEAIDHLPPFCRTIKASPNGFINIALTRDSLYYGIMSILHKGEEFSPPDLAQGKRIKIIAADSISTFSLNANDGRKIFISDFFKHVFPQTGYKAESETLVRGGGEMLWIIASMVEHHYREFLGDEAPLFFAAHRNKFAVETAREIIEEYAASFMPISREDRISVMKDETPRILYSKLNKVTKKINCDCGKIIRTDLSPAYHAIIAEIISFFEKKDMLYSEPVIPFKNWFVSQRPENRKSADEKVRSNIRNKFANEYCYWRSQNDAEGNIVREPDPPESPKHLIYKYEEQIWLRSTSFGDTEDRIIFLPGREPSDFLVNLATIILAFKNKYDKVLIAEFTENALDLHNQVSNIIKFMGYDPKNLEIVSVDPVTVSHLGGEPEPLRGESVDLATLLNEVERAALIFSYLRKSPVSPLDIDCSALKDAVTENPVFNIRFAFDRIKKLFKMAALQGFPTTSSSLSTVLEVKDLKVLTDERDLNLIKKVIRYPSVICDVVTQYNPSFLVSFIIELCEDFNNYYAGIKILSGEQNMIVARMAVVLAVRTVLGAAVSLLSLKV